MIRLKFALLVLSSYFAGILIGAPSSRVLAVVGLDYQSQPEVPGIWTFSLFFSLPMLAAILAIALVCHDHITRHFQWYSILGPVIAAGIWVASSYLTFNLVINDPKWVVPEFHYWAHLLYLAIWSSVISSIVFYVSMRWTTQKTKKASLEQL